MKTKTRFNIFSAQQNNIIVLIVLYLILSGQTLLNRDKIEEQKGSYYTGTYPNLFSGLLGKSESEINRKLDSTFQQLFYGDSTQRVYFPVGSNMAYIEDIAHNDVRSEGMSYGMMISVQLNKKQEYDHLWKWAKTYMQIKDGPAKDFFAWQLRPDGSVIDYTTASDGDEWFVTSLFFASARWGDSTGIFNYKAEAQRILDAMLNKDAQSQRKGTITSMFNKENKMVVFVPEVPGNSFTDPSYHLPHFYELWGKWAIKNNQFWFEAAEVSRKFLQKTVHPVTGLAPDYAKFDGSPHNPWGGGNNNFQFDAWRVAMNIAMDYTWFAKDNWQIDQSNRLLDFFFTQGIGNYGNQYTLDGKQLSKDYSTGLVAMNAVAALASTSANRKLFVEELWKAKIPSGVYRYYDGMLYMLGMLQVSGQFRIFEPGKNEDSE